MERRILDYPGEFNAWLWFLIKENRLKAYCLWYGIALILVSLAFVYSLPITRVIPDKVYNWLENEKVFLSIVSLITLLLRLPLMAILVQFSPDESQWIVGAATLVKDWRFWLAVDGTTSGPLNIFP